MNIDQVMRNIDEMMRRFYGPRKVAEILTNSERKRAIVESIMAQAKTTFAERSNLRQELSTSLVSKLSEQDLVYLYAAIVGDMTSADSWDYFVNDPSGIMARLSRIEYVAPYDVDAQGERPHELMYESFKIDIEPCDGEYAIMRLTMHTPESEFNPHGSDVDPWMIECRHDNRCEYPNAAEVYLYVEPGEYHQIGVINLTFTGDVEADVSEYLRKVLHLALHHSIITEELYPSCTSERIV